MARTSPRSHCRLIIHFHGKKMDCHVAGCKAQAQAELPACLHPFPKKTVCHVSLCACDSVCNPYRSFALTCQAFFDSQHVSSHINKSSHAHDDDMPYIRECVYAYLGSITMCVCVCLDLYRRGDARLRSFT